MKRVLLIAYAFPPMQSVGVYRALRFAKYLPACGWEPIVLTLAPSAIRMRDERVLDGLPPCVRIFRSRTVDPYLRLQDFLQSRRRAVEAGRPEERGRDTAPSPGGRPSVAGRIGQVAKDLLFSSLSTPDHMLFWIPYAVAEGMRILRRMRVDAIFTTTPPHSSQFIGLALARLSHVPCVADFRDPWTDNSAWSVVRRTRLRRRFETSLESLVVRQADLVLHVSAFYRDLVAARWPRIAEKLRFLPNGFDPEDFPDGISPDPEGGFLLSYFGSLYLFQRADPFLAGLRLWLDGMPEARRGRIRVLFAGHGVSSIAPRLEELGLSHHVELRGLMPHREATRQMLRSNALLLIVGSVPGSEGITTSKVFEYFASRRPILAIAPEGETTRLIREARAGCVVTDPSPECVARGLEEIHRLAMSGSWAGDPAVISRYDGRTLAAELAGFLDEITHGRCGERGANVSYLSAPSAKAR